MARIVNLPNGKFQVLSSRDKFQPEIPAIPPRPPTPEIPPHGNNPGRPADPGDPGRPGRPAGLYPVEFGEFDTLEQAVKKLKGLHIGQVQMYRLLRKG